MISFQNSPFLLLANYDLAKTDPVEGIGADVFSQMKLIINAFFKAFPDVNQKEVLSKVITNIAEMNGDIKHE